jgi:cytochrome c oxidase subunit 2
MRGKARRNLLWLGGALVLALALGACGKDLPMNTFDPAGPTAQSEKDILIWPLIISGIVFVLVEGGIVFLALKFRHRPGRDQLPTQLHGNTRLEIGWTIAPAVLLAVVFVPAVSLIWQLAERPPDAMQIEVRGYQWWWGFEYLGDDMKVSYGDGAPITTADVLVIPADTTIDLSLVSAGGGAHDDEGNTDHMVIHSFWAPRLFGKQDVVPGASGLDNHIVFSANDPGTYYGQCAEFCGLQHGMMKFRIVALDPTAWTDWVARQKEPAAKSVSDPAAAQGMDLFFGTAPNGEGGQCIACHEIGLESGTVVNAAAPNLTHFADADHQCFAGCDFEVFNPDGTCNKAAIEAWIRDPNAVKLGAKMPDYGLPEDQIAALTDYLCSLH